MELELELELDWMCLIHHASLTTQFVMKKEDFVDPKKNTKTTHVAVCIYHISEMMRYKMKKRCYFILLSHQHFTSIAHVRLILTIKSKTKERTTKQKKEKNKKPHHKKDIKLRLKKAKCAIRTRSSIAASK